jgi:hypothetical protein
LQRQYFSKKKLNPGVVSSFTIIGQGSRYDIAHLHDGIFHQNPPVGLGGVVKTKYFSKKKQSRGVVIPIKSN